MSIPRVSGASYSRSSAPCGRSRSVPQGRSSELKLASPRRTSRREPGFVGTGAVSRPASLDPTGAIRTPQGGSRTSRCFTRCRAHGELFSGGLLAFEQARCRRPTHADVAEVAATIGLDRRDFSFVVRRRRALPVEPPLPAIGHGVSHVDFHNACSFPVPAPPSGGMETPELRRPPRTKMIGKRTFDFSGRVTYFSEPRGQDTSLRV